MVSRCSLNWFHHKNRNLWACAKRHITVCFGLGFYEALLALLNKVLYFHLYRPSIFPSASPPTSFLSYNSKKYKTTETNHKKFTEWKQAHAGMEPSKTNQTRWEWHHNPFTPSLHLVPFCQLFTPQNSLHAHYPIPIHTPLNEHSTQHCSLHSLPHKDNPYPT